MLNKKDQKIIRQMMHHIRTFPLLDSEIRQFERDLTGMALEAEKSREIKKTKERSAVPISPVS